MNFIINLVQKIISNSNQILYRVNINKFEKVICLPEVYYW